MEQWKRISFMDDRYEVSNHGRLRSYAVLGSQYKKRDKSRILKQYDHKSGHKIVGLRVNDKVKQLRVHRIVAKHFIPNPHNYPHVLHKDDDPANNHVGNLYWGNDRLNYRDRVENSGHGNEGEHHGMSRLTKEQVIEIKKRIYNTSEFYKSIAKDYGVSEGTIRAIKDGKSWTHINLICESEDVPERKMELSNHHMAKKFRHKETGKIFKSGKEAAQWAGINYGTMISRVGRDSPKAEFEKID